MKKGDRLKRLREDANMSQVDAASKIGISKQTLYKYEQDIITNIPSDVVEKIAKVYGTTPAHIMGWDTSTENKYDPEFAERAIKYYKEFENLPPEKQSVFQDFLKFLQSGT